MDSAVLRLEANGCDPEFVFLLALLGFHAVFANRDGGAPDLEPMNHEVAPAPTRSKGCKPGTFLDFNAGLF